MKVIRAEIRAITASFRYPMFIVGYHPTYTVPPVTTVYGLLSAAKGEKVNSSDVQVGYDFSSYGMGEDLEKIYEWSAAEGKKPPRVEKSNIITRQFLYDCTLMLYIEDLGFHQYLKKPCYPLLLGRQSDLAYVRKIDEIELIARSHISLNHTILPFDGSLPGQVVSLPSDFTDEAIRKPRGVRTYVIIDTPQEVAQGYFDSERQCGVYLHGSESSRKE